MLGLLIEAIESVRSEQLSVSGTEEWPESPVAPIRQLIDMKRLYPNEAIKRSIVIIGDYRHQRHYKALQARRWAQAIVMNQNDSIKSFNLCSFHNVYYYFIGRNRKIQLWPELHNRGLNIAINISILDFPLNSQITSKSSIVYVNRVRK